MSSPKEILNSLVTSSLSSGEAASSAASQLTGRVVSLATSKVENAADDFLWSLWNELLHQTLPSIASSDATTFNPFPSSAALDKVVALVATLKGTQVTEIVVWGEKASVWNDLPLFGPQVRELLDQNPTVGLKGARTPSDDEARKWLAQMVFLARLVRGEVLPLDHLVIWVLRSALEEESTDGNRGLRASAAAAFLKECAGSIWSNCASGEGAGDLEKQHTKQGSLYEGPVWFCKERWEFWKSRMSDFCDGGLVMGKDRGRVKEALAAVKAVEKEC